MNRSKPTKKQSGAGSYAGALKGDAEMQGVSWRSPRPSSDKPAELPSWNEYVPPNPASNFSALTEYVPSQQPATAPAWEEYVPTCPSGDPTAWKEYVPSTNPPNFPAWGGFSANASAQASYTASVATQMQHDDWQNEPYFASNLKYYPHLPQPLWAGDYQTYADIKASISAGNTSQIRPPLTQFYATPRPHGFVPEAGRGPFVQSCGREQWMTMGYSSWRHGGLMNSAGMALPTVQEVGPNQEGQWEEEGAVGGAPLPGPGPGPSAVDPIKNDMEHISHYQYSHHQSQHMMAEGIGASATTHTQTAASYSMNLTFEVIQTNDSPYPFVRDNGTLIKPLPRAQYRPPAEPKKEDIVEFEDEDEEPSSSANFKPRASSSPLQFPPFE